MAHARDGLLAELVPGGRLEEFQHGRLIPSGRVGDVNDDRGPLQGLGQSLTGNRVDTRVGCGGYRLVPLPSKAVDNPGSDLSGAANHHDLHNAPSQRRRIQGAAGGWCALRPVCGSLTSRRVP